MRGSASVVGISSSGGGGGGGGGRVTSALHGSSRSRRYNRSHAGGTSFVPQNEFPIFSHTGDVEIVVRVPSGHENRYLLHRHILTRCSGFFEASTSNEWSRPHQAAESPASPATAGAIEGRPAVEGAPAATGGELARVGERARSSSDAARPPDAMALVQSKKRWRYELDYGSGDNDVPMLVQKDEHSNSNNSSSTGGGGASHQPLPSNSLFGGPPPASSSRHSHHKSSVSHSFFRSVANLSLSASHSSTLPPPTPEEQDLLRDYDNLFRIFYNYPPCLDAVNIADSYVQCKTLLHLADQYDALAVVGPRVDHHLLQFQSRLWKQIAKYPISYLRLGYLARSKIIFQEALIHVVGQWPAGERSIRAALPESVVDLIEDKVDELEETVSRVEARLFRLTLTTRTGERVTPANSYLDWLARQQRKRRQRRQRADGAPPGGGGATAAANLALTPAPVPSLASIGRTYRLLGGTASSGGGDRSGSGSGGGGYLGHDECKRFLKLTPELYTRDNLRRFEKRVEELKAMAREVVRPLMGSGLELEMVHGFGAGGIGYLTCTKVGERDLPWAYES
ncbi:hypothetical protein VTJ83DRAFT_6249 [Remersonia thermophila]|uniref:BTB domain-containing protein n=1 Tax=Remersonia thermophila TaxID=72144 RepID=A0ABR4D444_9PEZI